MAWFDTKQQAADPDNPADNEKLTATEYNNMVIDQLSRAKWEEDGSTAYIQMQVNTTTPTIFEIRDPDGNPIFRYNVTKNITYTKGRLSKIVWL